MNKLIKSYNAIMMTQMLPLSIILPDSPVACPVALKEV